MLSTAVIGVTGLVTQVPNPGQGTAPPGVGGPLDTILQWVAYIVIALAVAGILTVAGKMVISHHQGRGGEHMTGLAYVLAGCVLIASAAGIVGALV